MLAAAVGISRSHLFRIERGERFASDATAADIAKCLGVPLDAITYPTPGKLCVAS
jgi:transcriptional regulator with XRE-family HTH domain